MYQYVSYTSELVKVCSSLIKTSFASMIWLVMVGIVGSASFRAVNLNTIKCAGFGALGCFTSPVHIVQAAPFASASIAFSTSHSRTFTASALTTLRIPK